MRGLSGDRAGQDGGDLGDALWKLGQATPSAASERIVQTIQDGLALELLEYGGGCSASDQPGYPETSDQEVSGFYFD